MGLFNAVNNSTHREYVMDRLSEVSDIQNISPDDIENVLRQLKMGKSSGADHIHAEHFIHASDRLTVLLSILCTSIMKHGYIPSGMLDTTLTTIAYMSTFRHSYGVSVILASLKTSVPETKISII